MITLGQRAKSTQRGQRETVCDPVVGRPAGAYGADNGRPVIVRQRRLGAAAGRTCCRTAASCV